MNRLDAIENELDALQPCNEVESGTSCRTNSELKVGADGDADEADMVYNVGGHGKRSPSLAVRVIDDGEHISKVLSEDRKGASEHYFYEVAAKSPLFQPLRPHLATLSGTQWSEDKTQRRIILSNLLQGYVNPDIMDLKLGGTSWDPDATPSKVEYKRSKWHHQYEIALNVEGCHVAGEHYGKGKWTDIQDAEGAEEGPRRALSLFFSSRRSMLPSFVAQVEAIREWFSSQMLFHFINSSLLFVCDQNRAGLYMVDFAHVWPANTVDAECVRGLERLERMLQDEMMQNA